MNTLTVVIPTFNRAPVLKKALEGYLRQHSIDGIQEVLVIDDGCTDETHSVVEEVARRALFPVRYFRQENKGPAAARNVGIREARSGLILFTDDDIIPSTTLVADHLAWHANHPQENAAVLGRVTWADEVRPTPFMRWYGEQGALFSYGKFRNGQDLCFLDFYTCNLSLKADFLRKNGLFDEDFKSAAYEDIELAYRLERAGMKLQYNLGALAYHYQHITFEQACRRARKSAAASSVFREKEAGRYYYSRSAAGPSPAGRARFRSSLKKWAAPTLSPLKHMMDLQFASPAGVYRLMYRVFSS